MKMEAGQIKMVVSTTEMAFWSMMSLKMTFKMMKAMMKVMLTMTKSLMSLNKCSWKKRKGSFETKRKPLSHNQLKKFKQRNNQILMKN